jgi:eukaryotic-like serine/threonine-protein kinase
VDGHQPGDVGRAEDGSGNGAPPPGRCLDENTVVAFAQARLPPAALAQVEAHARQCPACHDLLLLALRQSGLAVSAATQRMGPAPAAPVVAARMRRDPLAAGTSIGRYTVLGLVGRGGMGEVYAAYDPGLDRRVALKLMHAEGAAQDDNAQERLWREAQSIAKLSHPNVVVVHDVGAFEGQVFVAMEFVEGATLAAWLTEQPHSWRDILGIFVQAARGLSAAHRAGLVHRDFKPQNVMVGPDGTARVMDFGLARRIDHASVTGEGGEEGAERGGGVKEGGALAEDLSLTRTGEQLGTPLYMAPEQFAAGRIDARTDQFSFCVALYRALYRGHPFGGGGLSELVKSAAGRQEAAAPPKSAVPAWVQRGVMRGLRLDPGARWASMDELVGELSRDPARRRRSVMVAAAGLAVFVAVGAWGVRASQRRQAFCQGGPARLAGAWELEGAAGAGVRGRAGAGAAVAGSRREAVRAAILKSGVSEAAKTWERVASLLDRHATRWLGAYREACEATHVRGEQSEDVLDLRMACLGDNLDSARALTQLLSGGDPRVVEHAVEAAGSLEDFGRCADVQQLRAGVQPPKDPMVRKEVAELRGKLKEGGALLDVGQRAQAAEVADFIIKSANALGYCPLKAEALALKGESLLEVKTDEAGAMLEKAVFTGERCSHDRLVARAAVGLVGANQHRNWKMAELWAAFASAALGRSGDPRLESWLANNLGGLRMYQGRMEEAQQQFEHAVLLKERLLGPDHPDLAVSLHNLSLALARLGHFQLALAISDRATVIWERWLAPDSFQFVFSLGDRGEILLGLGRFDDAENAFRRSLRILEVGVPSDGMEKADSLMGLGRLAIVRDRVPEAVVDFERALRLREEVKDSPFQIAESQFQFAVALDRSHHDVAQSMDLARKALATYATQPAFDKQHAEVQAWLASRRRAHVSKHGGDALPGQPTRARLAPFGK